MGKRQNTYNKFVFVYGNQMKTFGGNALLKNSKLMGEYSTKRSDFAIASLYGRACAFEVGPMNQELGAPIVGELYKVDADVAAELDKKNKVVNVSDKVTIKLSGFGKKVVMYLLDKPPFLPSEPNDKAFIIDKHAGLVYNWKEHYRKTYSYPGNDKPPVDTPTPTTPPPQATEDKRTTMPVVNNNTTTTTSPHVDVPTIYDPQVKMKDGTVVSRATLAWEILSIVDDMEYIMDATVKMSDADRGKMINESIDKVKEIGKKVMKF